MALRRLSETEEQHFKKIGGRACKPDSHFHAFSNLRRINKSHLSMMSVLTALVGIVARFLHTQALDSRAHFCRPMVSGEHEKRNQ